MVYYKLYAMESKGWVKCDQNRTRRIYSLTDKGIDVVNNAETTAKEIQRFARTLIKI